LSGSQTEARACKSRECLAVSHGTGGAVKVEEEVLVLGKKTIAINETQKELAITS
jgi:hypothetical protein